MSAGLPGFGLGGIFFILSALLAPVFELPRTLRGRSSRARWGRIAGHLALALAMIVALEVALEMLVTALGIGVSHAGHDAATGQAGSHAAATGAAGSGVSLAPLPVPPIAITAALLAGILALAKAAQVGVRLRLRSRFSHALLYLAVAFRASRRRPAERTDS
jgi:hypothetical protein